MKRKLLPRLAHIANFVIRYRIFTLRRDRIMMILLLIHQKA